MPERPHPDMDRVRDALRDREENPPTEPAPTEDEPTDDEDDADTG
jgi:hypothetical protein